MVLLVLQIADPRQLVGERASSNRLDLGLHQRATVNSCIQHTHHEALRSAAWQAIVVLELTQKTLDRREIPHDVLVTLKGTPPPPRCRVDELELFAEVGPPLVVRVGPVREEPLQPFRERIRHIRVHAAICVHRRTSVNEAG